MRLWCKVILIVLLAVGTTTSSAQSTVQASNAAPVSPATEQENIELPQHPACLTEEQESVHSSPHLRWPLMLPASLLSKKANKAARFAATNEAPFTADTPQQAFYRSLLFPAHFFR